MDYIPHRIVMFAIIVVFTVIGLYGNISLIVLHIRRPKLRTKYGLLISWLSCFQSLCLFFEWVGSIYTALSTPFVVRSTCFYLICIYVFAHCMQTGLLATIAVDLLLSIICPLLHRLSRNGIYVALISAPSALYGILSVTLGFIMKNDDTIGMCTPPSSLQKKANEFWYGAAFAIGAVTIVSYLTSYYILSYKHSKHTNQQEQARRSMRSLSIILLIFLLTRYTATISANVMNMVDANPDVVNLSQNYCVVMAVICYSQNFYVIFWRSADYRTHLRSQQRRLHNIIFDRCSVNSSIRIFTTSSAKREYTSTTRIELSRMNLRQ